jgi:hypothetical protein
MTKGYVEIMDLEKPAQEPDLAGFIEASGMKAKKKISSPTITRASQALNGANP